jgi:hypothetical protein
VVGISVVVAALVALLVLVLALGTGPSAGRCRAGRACDGRRAISSVGSAAGGGQDPGAGPNDRRSAIVFGDLD